MIFSDSPQQRALERMIGVDCFTAFLTISCVDFLERICYNFMRLIGTIILSHQW